METSGFSPPARNFFLLLLAFSAALRGVRLDQGFGYDEIYSLRNFFLVPLATILTDMHVPNNHPLYSLMARACILALGENEWTARLPAFIAGSLTPPFLYLLGRRLFGHRAGLIAGFLFGAGFWPLWHSGEARGYAPMILCSLLSVILFLDLRDRFSIRRAVGFVAVSVAAAYFHLYGGFVAVGCGVSALAMIPARRREGIRLAFVCLAAGLIFGALYLPYVPSLIAFAPYGRNMRLQGNRISAGLFASVLLDWPLGPYRRLGAAPLWAAAVAGIIPAWRQGRSWLTIWAAAMAAGLVVPLVMNSFVFARFFSFGLPGFFLLAAAGTDYLWRTLDRRLTGLGALVPAMAVVFTLTGTFHYFRYPQYSTRVVARWVEENAPGRKWMTMGTSREIMDYYLPRMESLPEQPLDPRQLRQALLIVRAPEALSKHDAGVLHDFCQPPVEFPSSGERQFDYRIFLCD